RTLVRREGADRGRPGQRQLRRRRRGLGVLRPTTPAGRPRWRGDRLHNQDALAPVLLPARQVTAVGERQGPGEVELGESEEGAQDAEPRSSLRRAGARRGFLRRNSSACRAASTLTV